MFRKISQSLKTLTVVLITLTLLASLMIPIFALEPEDSAIDYQLTRRDVVPVEGEYVNDFENNHEPAAIRYEVTGSTPFGSAIVLSGLGTAKTGTFTFTLVRGYKTTYVANWTASQIMVKAIYVKGADSYNKFTYEDSDPLITCDGLLFAPAKNKNIPEIGHITILIGDLDGTATTDPESTCPTDATTTTTTTTAAGATTTTTTTAKAAVTTTTAAPTTTTTPAVTTTTAAPTTTTTPAVTTTTKKPTTTTTPATKAPAESTDELTEITDEEPPLVGGQDPTDPSNPTNPTNPTNPSNPAGATTAARNTEPVETIDLGDGPIPQTGEATAQTSVLGIAFIALAVAFLVFKRKLSLQNA